MPDPGYRDQARQALKRAKELLAADQARYAALELRLAIEALTYDRAQAYLKELPAVARSKWQPKQMIDALLEIDPLAGSSYTLRIGAESVPGVAPTTMHTMGTETVFGLADIKKHYHLVGSMLHTPTMQQMSEGKLWDQKSARQKLEDTATRIEASLSSPIWNWAGGEFANFKCMRCYKSIHKRVRKGDADLVATCVDCGAAHRGERLNNGQTEWMPIQEAAPCVTEGCKHHMSLWRDEVRAGTNWTCPYCNTRQHITLGISPM